MWIISKSLRENFFFLYFCNPFIKYSSVPNRRACTFINSEKTFPPACSYFGLHIYWFREKVLPCTSIPSCTFIVIGMWILWDILEYFGIALGLVWQCFGILWDTLGMIWNTFVRFRYPFQPWLVLNLLILRKKIPPARFYFSLLVYWFWEKICLLHVYSVLHV